MKWEAEAKENVKLSIDDRLREALAHDESDEMDVFDAPSPMPDEEYDFPFEGGSGTGGPATPPLTQNEPDIPIVSSVF